MTIAGWLQAAIVFALVCVLVKPLGAYMARVFEGERVFLSPVLAPVERGLYRVCRIDASREMGWKTYAFTVVAFSLVSFAYLYVLLRTQAFLPLNPQGFGNLAPDLAWNTAVSFMTNTNWQFYSGESTLSYLSQMAGLGWHMFVSAGAGIAIAIALMRGLSRRSASTIGNFWVDLTRTVLYVLLPIAVAGSLLLVWQGVPQNFSGYTAATTVEGAAQSISQGPMASMEIIKELGTNGGGFVNANSAAPWENPTGLTNLIELVCMFLIGGALTYTFGRYVKDQRQGWVLFAAMTTLFVVGFTAAYAAEAAGNPIVHALGVAGGNMEGKEARFGIAASALFATMTTDTSCGAVNAMHDSFTALGGLVPMFNMQLGEVVFGGVGSGFYGIIYYAVLTVFIAGLMVGRTPEYLGKKIERREVQLAILAALVVPVFALVPAGIAAVLPAGTATLNNAGPHGFSEILYAYSSMVNNNGSAFAGLGANAWWNVSGGIVMLFGRIAIMIPVIALAGALAAKRAVPATAGTFGTTSPIFVMLLIGVIVIVGALTFFPADALGPVVEHLLSLQGKQF
ncbi:MAG: potassium-transporting ATPase potassium-binding subunit [Candidatus Eremiobacteraeota bacterium]|jgi:K+-transporting ATPase ATPase A chain|nr:potassium-transporting ATPase potassium-binding subunit [Candidatus Eremiobacteraeota bacterium]